MSLTAQEIRVALFLGPAVDWVRELNHNQNWRSLYGNPSPRLKDHELVLRCLAMREVVTKLAGHWDDDELKLAAYTPPMSEFLNSYLRTHRKLGKRGHKSTVTKAFEAATQALFKAGGADGLRFSGRINAAHVDAVVSSLMWLSENDSTPSTTKLKAALKALRSNPTYTEYVTKSTSHRENVYGRLHLAVSTLSK